MILANAFNQSDLAHEEHVKQPAVRSFILFRVHHRAKRGRLLSANLSLFGPISYNRKRNFREL